MFPDSSCVLRGGRRSITDFGFQLHRPEEERILATKVRCFRPIQEPGTSDELLEVELTVEELKEKSVKLGFNISNKEKGELLATGYLVIVTADRNAGKATPIPKEIVDKLKPLCKQIL